ncbi:uncharacterized protein LOC124296600 [Neodiprion lecontei]|uniref:Uncharacterized protein LOC124296600 n=1 Tax=Neodiprion lecontei TaxID=441921 RepID=A0ABM3GQP9_NEOLC|nr:uncharacterized protein LOC124296600 [Neodiprion lecontei]
MIDEEEFEQFAAEEIRKMATDRTPSWSRGRGQRVPGPPGTWALDDEIARAQNGGRENATVTSPPPEFAPNNQLLRTQSRNDIGAQEPPFQNVNDMRADDSGSSGQPRVPPPGQSTPAANASLVNAVRDILANQNREEAMAHLFAGLMLNQPRSMPNQQLGPSIPSYHVIPDLSRNIETFSGENDGIRAKEWLQNLESMQQLHQWPRDYLLEAARMHLSDGAKDWFRCRARELKTWDAFREAFRQEFIFQDDLTTRFDRMRARVQGKGESLVKYFHAKAKMCSELSLTYRELKAQVLIGLWSRELANAVMPSMQYTTTELLHELLYFESIFAQRAERIRSSRETTSARPRRQVERPSGDESKRTDVSAGRRDTRDVPTERGTSTDVRKCYNCNKDGHIARDCPSPKRVLTCYKCGGQGHISTRCTGNKERTVKAVGKTGDTSAQKYFKNATINGRDMAVFIDSGNSDCTMRISRVLRKQFEVKWISVPLQGFGPPEHVTTSPGFVEATIIIDGVDVPGVPMRVVPDDVQGVDALIGRTFTEADSVDCHKVGSTLTFSRNAELPRDVNELPTHFVTAEAVTLPPHTVGFINVVNDQHDYVLPVSNFGNVEKNVGANDGRWVRGEVSRVWAIDRANIKTSPINEEDIDVGPEQPKEVVQELCELINEYRDCVSTNLFDLGCAKNVEMEIQVNEGSKPVCSKPYRTSEKERCETKEMLREWREAGIITDTQSPYASPVLLVKKKSGDSRLCVDFRKLNEQTKRVHFPLPNIDDHLAQVRNGSIFIVLDLAHGYLQIPLSKDAREKTAIITSEETAEFTRMVFGLMNGPAFFSKAMHRALGPLRDKVVLFYLDDILVPGSDWVELKAKLRMVLESLRNGGLTIKLEKCKFLYKKVSYLGYELSGNGIEPGVHKVAAIREFPAPTNVHEVRRYLGLTGYFRKFVPRYAHIAEPLTDLLKMDNEFVWGDEQNRAFESSRAKLTEQPVLQTFDPKAITELHTDASAVGLAAMLMQRDAADKLRLVYALSRRTSEPERRYHSSKLELLAIMERHAK